MTKTPNNVKFTLFMHQMHISTIDVSLVMLRPNNLEIRNVMTVMIPQKIQIECYEMEPNLSEDIKNRTLDTEFKIYTQQTEFKIF
jgi:ABC-type molybdate transport system ATPase subunit